MARAPAPPPPGGRRATRRRARRCARRPRRAARGRARGRGRRGARPGQLVTDQQREAVVAHPGPPPTPAGAAAPARSPRRGAPRRRAASAAAAIRSIVLHRPHPREARLSSTTVIGPSLTDSTRMSAPKTPRSTCAPEPLQLGADRVVRRLADRPGRRGLPGRPPALAGVAVQRELADHQHRCADVRGGPLVAQQAQLPDLARGPGDLGRAVAVGHAEVDQQPRLVDRRRPARRPPSRSPAAPAAPPLAPAQSRPLATMAGVSTKPVRPDPDHRRAHRRRDHQGRLPAAADHARGAGRDRAGVRGRRRRDDPRAHPRRRAPADARPGPAERHRRRRCTRHRPGRPAVHRRLGARPARRPAEGARRRSRTRAA